MKYVKIWVRRMLVTGLFVAAIMVTFQFITGFSGYDLLSWVMH